MSMWLPAFLLYGALVPINIYLPLFLRDMGYSMGIVGVLLALAEFSGLIVPFLLSNVIDKTRQYGLFAIIYGLLMVFLPIPLMYIEGAAFSALFLAVYAVGYRGVIPVTDSHISYLLGKNIHRYGMVRAIGSFGFVALSIVLQYIAQIDSQIKMDYILWSIIPSALFILSMLTIPGLLSPCKHMTDMPNVIQPEKSKNNQKLAIREKIKQNLGDFPFIFWFGMFIIFLSFVALVFPTKLLSVYLLEELKVSNFAVPWAASVIAEIPFMFFAYRLLRRYNTLKLLLFCSIFVSIRLILYVIFPSFIGVTLIQIIHAINYGIYHPAAVLFVTKYAPQKKLVLAMTLYVLVTVGLATVVGSVLSGFIIQHFGYATLFISFSILPLIGLIAYFIYKEKLTC